MEEFSDYLQDIVDSNHRKRMETIFDWMKEKYPSLTPKFAWEQPMYLDHGTFIIGFSMSKHHMSVSPEREGIDYFSDAIHQSGYDHGKNQFKIPWAAEIDYDLLSKMIDFNIAEKAEINSFWRK